MACIRHYISTTKKESEWRAGVVSYGRQTVLKVLLREDATRFRKVKRLFDVDP